MGSLEAYEQRVNQYSKQSMEQAFPIKANFFYRKVTRFHQDQREGRSFLEKKHMEEQVRVRIVVKIEVKAKEEEEQTFS